MEIGKWIEIDSGVYTTWSRAVAHFAQHHLNLDNETITKGFKKTTTKGTFRFMDYYVSFRDIQCRFSNGEIFPCKKLTLWSKVINNKYFDRNKGAKIEEGIEKNYEVILMEDNGKYRMALSVEDIRDIKDIS